MCLIWCHALYPTLATPYASSIGSGQGGLGYNVYAYMWDVGCKNWDVGGGSWGSRASWTCYILNTLACMCMHVLLLYQCTLSRTLQSQQMAEEGCGNGTHQVRHSLWPQVPEPGGSSPPRLHRRLRPPHPRRHRDRPGAPHQDDPGVCPLPRGARGEGPHRGHQHHHCGKLLPHGRLSLH